MCELGAELDVFVTPNEMTYGKTTFNSVSFDHSLILFQFFSNNDRYNYSHEEVESVFAAMVWPQLHLLPDEGTYSPTPLLKLFLEWTECTRYVKQLL